MGGPTRELLVERRVASPEAVSRAEAAAERNGTRVCSELLAAGEASEGALVAVLSERHGWPGVDLSRSEIPAAALGLVPHRVALTDTILPLSTEGGRLHLAVADPDASAQVLDEVRFVTGMEISPYLAVAGSLRKAILEAYGGAHPGSTTWRGARASPGCAFAVTPPGEVTLPDGEEDVASFEEPLPEASDRAEDERHILVVDDEPEILSLIHI